MMEPQRMVNVLMMAHHFTLEVAPMRAPQPLPVDEAEPEAFRIAGKVCEVPV